MNMERIGRSTFGVIGLTFSSLFFVVNAHAAIIENSNADTSSDAFIGDCLSLVQEVLTVFLAYYENNHSEFDK